MNNRATKRKHSDDENYSEKRPRTGNLSRNSAANRLKSLQQNIHKSRKKLAHTPEKCSPKVESRDSKYKSASNNNVKRTSSATNIPKSKCDIYSGTPKSLGKGSINNRLKKIHKVDSSDEEDDDDTIIEIDNSPAPNYDRTSSGNLVSPKVYSGEQDCHASVQIHKSKDNVSDEKAHNKIGNNASPEKYKSSFTDNAKIKRNISATNIAKCENNIYSGIPKSSAKSSVNDRLKKTPKKVPSNSNEDGKTVIEIDNIPVAKYDKANNSSLIRKITLKRFSKNNATSQLELKHHENPNPPASSNTEYFGKHICHVSNIKDNRNVAENASPIKKCQIASDTVDTIIKKSKNDIHSKSSPKDRGKPSVNDRLKKIPKKAISNDKKDDTVIVIDDSPANSKSDHRQQHNSAIKFCDTPTRVVEKYESTPRSFRQSKKLKSTLGPDATKEPYEKKGISVDSPRVWDSLITISEASDGETSLRKTTPINNRLKVNKCTTYSVKTLTPDSDISETSDRSQRTVIEVASRKQQNNQQNTSEVSQQLPVSPNILPKSVLIEQWMESVHTRPIYNEEPIDDSMMVNVDNTLLDKTELMVENRDDDSMEWDAVPEATAVTCERLAAPNLPVVLKEKLTCIVTDTNVFMHNLPQLRDILDLRLPDEQKLKIYVPWMVLQELDHLKDHSPFATKSLALNAQKFINRQLVQPDSKIIGQSIHDLSQQLDIGKSPDDKILACCLQAKDKYQSVILLSSDVNLCNKVMANDIKAYSPRQLLEKMKSGKCLKVKVRLQTLLSQIIQDSCRSAYGEAFSKMDMLHDGPWSFDGCLRRFKKYWRSVFDQLLLKQCQKCIDELIVLSDKADCDPTETRRFSDKVKEFLFYLQDLENFKTAVKKVGNELDQIMDGTNLL